MGVNLSLIGSKYPAFMVHLGVIQIVRCLRCQYEWATKQEHPLRCPKCKSVHWKTKRQSRLLPISQVGDIRKGKELGYKDASHLFQWLACPDCGVTRWILLKNNKPQRLFCKHCVRRGVRCEQWKGGKELTLEGYIRIKLNPSDPFYPMADAQGRVMEHRLVMAKHLGRCLEDWEVIHHKGTRYSIDSIENRQDNQIDNLELTINGEHVSQHRQEEVRNGIDPFHGKGYRRRYN